jgi:type IV pilus assembly protein PilF
MRLTIIVLAALFGLAGCVADGTNVQRNEGFRSQSEAPDESSIIGEVGPPRERARAHSELASAYYEQGNMGVALEEARIAISADPAYAPAYTVLGLVHMDLKENAMADENFQRALRLAPNDPDANHNYGWFLCQSGREDVSLKYFLQAIRNPLYSSPQKSYTVAGICAARKNNDRDAVEYLERALRLDSGYLAARINLAQLRYRRGEYDQARVLISDFNRSVEPTAESLWLALRIERRFGDKSAETNLSEQLRRRFAGSPEFQSMQRGQYE